MSLITLVMAVSAGVVASVPAAHAATLYDSPTWAQMERAIAAAEGREYVETKAVRRDPTFDQMERLIRAIPGAGGGGCDTNAVDALANSAVVTNALTVATTNRVAALETATNNLSSSVSGLASSVSGLQSSKADKATPRHAGNFAALTADGNLADSMMDPGYFVRTEELDGYLSLTGGVVNGVQIGVIASGSVSMDRVFSFGSPRIDLYEEYNLLERIAGIKWYYGESEDPANEIAVKGDISAAISATNPTFSDAVLAVQISTNDFAALYELKEAFSDLPIDPVTGGISVGGLLAALAAAAAWLKKNKVGSFDSVGGATATVENGVAKLGDFFTESNSLLTGTIEARLPYPLYAVPSTGILKDRAINTTSLASVTVPDNFTDLLIRASVASSLSVTMPEAITKYGDTFPGEAGEYLITITKTGAEEAYVRTIKLEVANA